MSELSEASEQQEINPADCFKILLATDIHLGYKEKDVNTGIGYFVFDFRIWHATHICKEFQETRSKKPYELSLQAKTVSSHLKKFYFMQSITRWTLFYSVVIYSMTQIHRKKLFTGTH